MDKNRRFRRNDEYNDNPLQPIDASTDDARAAGSLGYHSFSRNMDGTITSGINARGKRVAFRGGLSPEEASTQDIRDRLDQERNASASANPPSVTTTPSAQPAPPAQGNPFAGPRTLSLGGQAQPSAPQAQPTAQPAPGTGSAQPAATPARANTPAPRPTGLGGMPKPGAMWEGFGNAPATINLGRGAGVQGDGLPHDVAVVANALERNQPAAAPGFYGKLSQSDPTHTVNPGEVAYVNGQPVAPGNSVTFTGAGQNGAVVQGMYNPADHLPGPSKATPPVVASTSPASPASATPAAPSSLTNLSGAGATLPTPQFAPTNGSSATTARPLPADTATRQTPAVPAFNLATGTTATSEPPAGTFAGFGRPTVPPSTVAGSTIQARDIRTPQAPATPMERLSNDTRAGSSLITATLPPTYTRVRRDGFGGDDDDELAAPAAPAPGGVTPLRSTQAAPAPATAPPTQVVPDAGNANSHIGTPDYGSQRVAPKSLGADSTPGSVTDAKGFYTGTSTALAGVLGAPAATALLASGIYNPADHVPGGNAASTAAKPAQVQGGLTTGKLDTGTLTTGNLGNTGGLQTGNLNTNPIPNASSMDPERLRRLKAASSVVPGMAGVFGGFA